MELLIFTNQENGSFGAHAVIGAEENILFKLASLKKNKKIFLQERSIRNPTFFSADSPNMDIRALGYQGWNAGNCVWSLHRETRPGSVVDWLDLRAGILCNTKWFTLDNIQNFYEKYENLDFLDHRSQELSAYLAFIGIEREIVTNKLNIPNYSFSYSELWSAVRISTDLRNANLYKNGSDYNIFDCIPFQCFMVLFVIVNSISLCVLLAQHPILFNSME